MQTCYIQPKMLEHYDASELDPYQQDACAAGCQARIEEYISFVPRAHCQAAPEGAYIEGRSYSHTSACSF